MNALLMIAPFIVYNFLKYAKSVERININDWITKINTKRNRTIVGIAATIDIIIVLFKIAAIFNKLAPMLFEPMF